MAYKITSDEICRATRQQQHIADYYQKREEDGEKMKRGLNQLEKMALIGLTEEEINVINDLRKKKKSKILSIAMEKSWKRRKEEDSQ